MDIRWQLAFISGLALAVTTVTAAPQPISAFARREQVRAPRISPDGRHLLVISNSTDRRIAVVTDLENPAKVSAVMSSKHDSEVDLSWCEWGNNSRIVCGFTSTEVVGGTVFRKTQLAAANSDGKDFKVLMNSERFGNAQFRDAVLDWTPDDPQTVLIQSTEMVVSTGTHLTTSDLTPAVFKLDLYSGGTTRVLSALPNMWRFHTDGNGQVRLATGYVGTRFLFSARLVGETQWRSLARVEAFAETGDLIPQHVISGTNQAYALGGSNGRQALWEIDLEDKVSPRLIFEHPIVDIDDFDFEAVTGKLLGYRYDTDRPFYQYEDERLAVVMRAVNKALPDSFNRAVSYSHGLGVFAIRAESDVNAGTYYVFDKATRKLAEIGKAYPELDAKQLGRTRSIEYQAQDGTTIPGYITTPLNLRATNLPLIVMPHGGPIARDRWRFDFLTQFLVSRGYAVLQMNFRGSDGYGSDWFHAAHQDWGGLTHSDITDGARWAITQGIADPKRTCILGWSFGGYSALLGAVRNGDLYKCAVSIAGLSDLADLYDDQSKYAAGKITKRQIGDNRTKLKEDSPARHAKDATIPVLLIHGTRDAQAPFEQSKKMARALKTEKKVHKFVEIEGADHSLWRQAERETMLREVEEFLKTHLGTGTPPQG